MAPRFKVNVITKSEILRKVTIYTIVIFSFLLIFFSKTDYYLGNLLKNISSSYINPVTKIISSPVYLINNITNELKYYRNIKSENLILKEEIIRLKKWQTLALQNSRENKVLKKLLNATDNNLNLIKTASLVNRNDNIFSKIINVNAGSLDNITKDMTAINERGLVGKVVDTAKNKSRILLLTDTTMSLSVKTVSSEVFSLVHGAGDGNLLVSSFIKDEKFPKLGDIVVTSGTAQIFPADLLVGKISKIENNRFYILPFVDFNNIDYVQIIKSK